MDEFPRLRPIKIQQRIVDNQAFFIIQDATGISDESLVLTPPAALILQWMDGRHSVNDIQDKFQGETGVEISQEEIIKLAGQLEKNFMLEGPDFADKLNDLISEYNNQKVRKPWIAGKGYPDNKKDLSAFIDALKNDETTDEQVNQEIPKAIIVPHIDLRAGGSLYHMGYEKFKNLDKKSKKEVTFIILGISHTGTMDPFTPTRKDFQTPFGIAETDQDFLDSLEKNIDYDLYIEEFAHRSEHSIEFQVVFLQHYIRNFKIVPILCSFDHISLDDPIVNEKMQEFIEALKTTISESKREIYLIAGVDLSHVGPMYGNMENPDESTIKEVMRLDKNIMKPVLEGDGEKFMKRISKTENSTAICGLPAIYTILSLYPGKPGNMLAHEHTVMDSLGSFVTFAVIEFY